MCMHKKVREKKEAIFLRKKGYTYNEILQKVSVSKSSLSEWLKDLPLTKDEKSMLRTRKDSNISKGRIRAATAHHLNRLRRDKVLFQEGSDSKD